MKNQVKPEWANLTEDESGIDIECLALCEALNLYPGIKTCQSCCGHGKKPFKIWFTVKNLVDLPEVCYYFDRCHCDCEDWNIKVHTDCGMSPVVFLIEGPIGKRGYKEAEKIAKLLTDWIYSDERKKRNRSPDFGVLNYFPGTVDK